MPPEISTIPISKINLRNTSHQITTNREIDDLAASIQACGLINEPVLLETPVDFIIVSGFRRVRAFLKLNRDCIRTKVLPSDTFPLDSARIAIADNSLQRPLNLIEISRAFYLLEKLFTQKKSLMQEAQKLGLPASKQLYSKIQNLHRLPSSMRTGIIDGFLSLPIANILQTLPKQIAVEMTNLFHALQCSMNKQRELISLLDEIAIRENSNIVKILREPSLLEIIQNPEMDKNLKTKLIREKLKKRRFPKITESELRFKTLHNQLNLQPEIQLTAPRDFEGQHYCLSLLVKNIEQLQSHIQRLQTLAQHPALKKILQ